MTKKDILKIIEEENINFFRIQFVDINGFMKNGISFLKLFVPDGVPAALIPLVTLIEAHELRLLGIEDLGIAVQREGLKWIHLPIRDVDVPELQLYALPDFDRRAERKAVNVAQALRPEAQPVGIVSQRLQRLHLDRVVLGHRVVARIGKQCRLHGILLDSRDLPGELVTDTAHRTEPEPRGDR